MIKELSRTFPAIDVKQRKSGGQSLDYIPVNVIEERLNEVFGVSWSWEIITSTIDLPSMSCVICGRLSYQDEAGNVHRKDGVGADEGLRSKKALDDVVKTAEAEALKKAAVKIGVGLYLWREEERRALADERRGTKPAPARSPQSDDWKTASRRLQAVVREVAPSLGMTPEQAFDGVRRLLGVASSTEATAQQLIDAAVVIRGNPGVLVADVMSV